MSKHTSLQSLLFSCPRCGKGKLFSGLLSLKENCAECGLSYKEHDVGDGAVFFGIVGAGFLVTFLAGLIEYLYQPPYWLHALLWVPLILFSSFLLLRVSKALLLGAAYRHNRLGQEK